MSDITKAVPGEGTQQPLEEIATPPKERKSRSRSKTDPDAPKKKATVPRRRKPPDKSPPENEPSQDTPTEPPKAPPRAPVKKIRQAAIAGPDIEIVTIDAEQSVESERQKAKDKFLDIIESLRTGRYLTDTLQGVERANRGDEPMAIVYHGDIKIIIPASQALVMPEELRTKNISDLQYNMLTRRLGAEIDYVIKGLDGKAGVAVASRLEAMRTRRRHYYFAPKDDGTYRIYDGVYAEARVVAVVTTGVFAEVFGVESFIPLKEMSYTRIMDANGYVIPGDRILVKVIGVERGIEDQVKVELSIKQATSNPMEQAIKKLIPGNSYAGTVVLMDERGIFVALDMGAECRCKFPRRGRPVRGARVIATIEGVDNERFRVWGSIIHYSNPK